MNHNHLKRVSILDHRNGREMRFYPSKIPTPCALFSTEGSRSILWIFIVGCAEHVLKTACQCEWRRFIFSKDPKTVAMMLGHELPPSYRSYEIRRRATLDTFVGFIDVILHTYIALIKTQRHTAKRKFKIPHYENRRCPHLWGQNTRAEPPVHRAAITLFV